VQEAGAVGDEPSIPEDRLDQVDVGQMRRGRRRAVRIVGDDHIAGLERAHRFERGRVADAAEAGHAELDRIGEELALRVEQAAGEVGGLLHERRVRRPLDDVGHLLDGALQIVPEDLHRERVQTHQPSLRRIKFPKRSTSPR
jgi:hypothetical protein